MVKCGSCGFESKKPTLCANCGGAIQRYVRALRLLKPEDVDEVKRELALGNIVILYITHFKSSMTKLKRVIDVLKEYMENVGGDVARLGYERVVLTPPPFKIYRELPKPTPEHQLKRLRGSS